MDSSIFESFRATLNGGGVKAVSAPQLFATPPELAARMVELADIVYFHRVLEPSAGTGNLLRAILSYSEPMPPEVLAVEINRDLCGALAGMQNNRLCVWQGDFLTFEDAQGFDRVIMNPPFENGADIKHIEHARGMLRDGGVLVALCADGPRQQRKLKPMAEESGGFYESLPAGTFKSAGTMVNAALLVIYK